MNRHPYAPDVLWMQTTQGFVMKCSHCQQQATSGLASGVNDFAAVHQRCAAQPTHLGLGDVVAAATKAVGIKPCTPCEARQRQLNGLFPRVWKR
jgi:hypothetical protein